MNELILALNMIQEENGIDKEEMFQAIEQSLLTACKKNFGTSDNIEVTMDRKTGAFKVVSKKTVVEAVMDPSLEISLEDALKINAAYQLGDICQIEVTPKNFSRIAAQNAKQIIVQKIHEAERRSVYNEYKPMEKEIVSGLIQRKEKGNVYINLGKIEAQLGPKEQIPGEAYPMNKRLVQTVVDTWNIRYNGLTALGAILGGRIEFVSDENPLTGLMGGKMVFHHYMSPPPPAKEIEGVFEYDPSYLNTLFN